MKKIILITFSFFLLIPNIYASVLNEVPPYIEMEGIKENNYNITKTITNDSVIIKLEEKNTGIKYSWSFNKNEIKDKIKLNFDIDFESKKAQEIETVAGTDEKLFLSFGEHGKLPSTATIKVDVTNKFKDGDVLYLYYYNEKMKNVELIESNIKVVDGTAEFNIDHCSEYFLIGTVINDSKHQSKNTNKVIAGLTFLIIALLAFTIFKK